MSTEAICELATAAQTMPPKSLVVDDLASFLAMEFPPRELMLDPCIPTSGLCMIHAARGIGKTHVALGIAYAVATGGSFLTWKAPIPRGVMYIDGEMPASSLKNRLLNIVAINDLGEDRLTNIKLITPDRQDEGMPDLSTPEGQTMINEKITEDINLIIIDNLSCLAPSVKENDSSDWVQIQSWILSLRRQGKSVLIIHHSGKNGSQRGSSRREDILDTVISLTRPHNYISSEGARFVVTYEKSRGFYGDEAKAFETQLCSDDGDKNYWKVSAIPESNFDKVVKLYNEGWQQCDIVEELGLNKGTVSKYVKAAREQGSITCSN